MSTILPGLLDRPNLHGCPLARKPVGHGGAQTGSMFLQRRTCSQEQSSEWLIASPLLRQAAQESIAQATARVLGAMARKGKLVRHLRGLLQQA